MLFYRMDMEFKDKILLYCFREAKFKQGFTTGILYYLYNALVSQNSGAAIGYHFPGGKGSN